MKGRDDPAHLLLQGHVKLPHFIQALRLDDLRHHFVDHLPPLLFEPVGRTALLNEKSQDTGVSQYRKLHDLDELGRLGRLNTLQSGLQLIDPSGQLLERRPRVTGIVLPGPIASGNAPRAPLGRDLSAGGHVVYSLLKRTYSSVRSQPQAVASWDPSLRLARMRTSGSCIETLAASWKKGTGPPSSKTQTSFR